MISMIRSLWGVFRHAVNKRVTVQYPDEKPYLAPRWRGRIVLTHFGSQMTDRRGRAAFETADDGTIVQL